MSDNNQHCVQIDEKNKENCKKQVSTLKEIIMKKLYELDYDMRKLVEVPIELINEYEEYVQKRQEIEKQEEYQEELIQELKMIGDRINNSIKLYMLQETAKIVLTNTAKSLLFIADIMNKNII